MKNKKQRILRKADFETTWCPKCGYGFGLNPKLDYGPYYKDSPDGCPNPKCSMHRGQQSGMHGQKSEMEVGEIESRIPGFGNKFYVDNNMAFDNPEEASMAGPFFSREDAEDFADDITKEIKKKYDYKLSKYFDETGLDSDSALDEELPSILTEDDISNIDDVIIERPSKVLEKMRSEKNKARDEYYEKQKSEGPNIAKALRQIKIARRKVRKQIILLK